MSDRLSPGVAGGVKGALCGTGYRPLERESVARNVVETMIGHVVGGVANRRAV